MTWKLRAPRYTRPGNEQLVQYIIEELHYADYKEVREFYNWFVQDSPAKNFPQDFALLAANDRFFLLTGILGRQDAMHPWVYDRAREVEAEPDNCLDLWGRFHYKSTLITFAGSIQEVLIDPELTCAIFSYNREIAIGFLRQIKRELEQNTMLKLIAPDVFWYEPRKESPKWSEGEGLVVKRKSNPKEATWEAWGLVDAQPVSKHFKLLIYNDVVTMKSVSDGMLPKVTEAWELSDNLGIGSETRKWHEGTRYSFADTYQEIIDRKILKVRLYPSTDNGKRTGTPVFLSKGEWEHILKTQRSVLAAQHLQNPALDQQSAFDMAWFKSYEIRPALLNIYIVCDPSGGKTNKSDRTAMMVIGYDKARNKYLLDGYCHRMKLSERWKHLKALHQKWSNEPGVQDVYVGYESYGMQADIEHFQHRMADEKYDFEIVELNWAGPQAVAKNDRIQRLQPDIEGTESKFYFPHMVYHEAEGVSVWQYDGDKGMLIYDCCEIRQAATGPDGKKREIATGQVNQTKLMAAVDRMQQPWRKAQVLRRIDEDKKPYDLTRLVFKELIQFPAGGHPDAIDAMSRIYDEAMKLEPPAPFEQARAEVIAHAD